MGDDYDVSMIVYMIFEDDFFYSNEMIMRKSTLPTCLFAKELHERMLSVLFIRNRITSRKWQIFFNTCFNQMLSSHEMYVTFVMFACFRESECYLNKFESFLSVCSLVKYLSDETLQKSGVNFKDLNPDLFMTFYDYHLKDVFKKCGGFRRLVEHIRNHKFLRWIENWGDPVVSSGKDLNKKIEKQLRRERVIEKETDPDEIAMDLTSIALAMEVLSTAQSVPPSLKCHLDIIRNVTEYEIKKMVKYSKGNESDEKSEVISEDLNVLSGSNSDSKSDSFARQQDNIE